MAKQTRDSIRMKELEDAFVKVTFEEDEGPSKIQSVDPFYDQWVDQASAKFDDPGTFAARALRKLYPKHSVVLFADFSVNLFGFPGALIKPLEPSELITSLYFVPLARRLGKIPGVLIDQIKFGLFSVSWDKYDFVVYVVKYLHGFGDMSQHYILHEGPEDPSRALVMAAAAWNNQLHDEILVYNQGFWAKSHALWTEVQKANWDDVILSQEFKDALQKDVYGFFESEELYKSLAIPWKRGLIMYGPPGNGKTISMKALMKDGDAMGYAPLYVKSFKSWKGEEGSMADVFEKAREMAPCIVVLEDLDSLINDQNRSFFLNQLDGLEGNDGLLIIGSTNHFDKLDPALSGRPSRFDRKYLFDDPSEEERAQYAKYWQDKLQSNKSVSFPDSLVEEIAASTAKFSFAYLKEAFVSSLVILAGFESDHKPSFANVIRGQIKSLRSQLEKDSARAESAAAPFSFSDVPPRCSSTRRLDAIPAWLAGQSRIWDTGAGEQKFTMPGGMPGLPPQKDSTSMRGGREPGSGKPFTLGGTAAGRSFIC